MSEYTPITGELRDAMRQLGWVERDGSITFSSASTPPSIDAEKSLAISGSDFDRRCDAIDAIHAQLERENESLKAELDRVLGEQNEERHTVGESITGELREAAAKTECANGRCEKLYRGDLDHIADRIDEAYGHACWCYEEEFDGWKFIHDTEFVELPKDIDGKPIHIGDVMVMDGDFELCEVVGFYDEGFLAWRNGRYVPCDASLYRHATPDTWERIIEDALDGYHDTDFDALVARCKALCERTKEGDAE